MPPSASATRPTPNPHPHPTNPCALHASSTRTARTPQDNAGDVLFGVQTTATLSCADAPSEAPVVLRESQRRLACHLKQGCAHLYNAIELSLEESVEKMSASLGREALYTKKARFSRLPPYAQQRPRPPRPARPPPAVRRTARARAPPPCLPPARTSRNPPLPAHLFVHVFLY